MNGSSKIFLLLLFLVLPGVLHAKAFPVHSAPIYDPRNDEYSFFIGGFLEDGSTLIPTDLSLEIDGKIEPILSVNSNLLEYSQINSESKPTWKTPIAVGLVYLWVKETPSTFSDAILQGIDNFFKRLPPRASAYATLYGRKRQPVPKLKSAEIAGNLYDIGFLDGTRPNLAEAIRINLRTLQTDDSPLKFLLLITDGRDFTDPYGEISADFTSISTEISKAGIKLLLLNFPSPESDLEQVEKNLSDLASQSSFTRTTDQPNDLQSTLASLGQAIADLRRATIPISWSWKTFGGTRKLRLNTKLSNKSRPIELGNLSIAASGAWKLWSMGIVLLLATAAGAALFFKRHSAKKTGGVGQETVPLISSLHALMHRGLPARRILVELTRKFPHDVTALASLDFLSLPSNRWPIFRTQSGKRRLQEVLVLLRAKDGVDSSLGEEFASFLSGSITQGTQPSQIASTMQVKFTEDQIAFFARLSLNELAIELRKWANKFPILNAPKTRGIALEVQGILHTLSKGAVPINVAWLVRAGGAGAFGETLHLPAHVTRLGSGTNSAIRVSPDGSVNEDRAEIHVIDGAYYLLPGYGVVTVEGRQISNKQLLRDGYTICLGASQFVFKQVNTGFNDKSSG